MTKKSLSEHASLLSAYRDIYFRLNTPVKWSAFSIVTAYNPRSIPLPQTSNLRHQIQLQERVQLREWKAVSLLAGNRDFTYYEPSLAILLTQSEAINLAKDVEQNAIYWIENDGLWLLPVLMPRHYAEYLGRFSPRCQYT